jgi:hypothetical protein
LSFTSDDFDATDGLSDADDSDASLSDDPSNVFDSIGRGPIIDRNEIFNKRIHTLAFRDRPMPLIDFGESYFRDFDQMLTLFDEKLLSMEYCDPYIFPRYYDDELLSGQEFKHDGRELGDTLQLYSKIIADGMHGTDPLIGYIPWKLFRSDIIYEDRDEDYVLRYNDKIQKTINIVKDINGESSEEKKIEKFKKYFPKTKLLKQLGIDNSHIMEFIPQV